MRVVIDTNVLISALISPQSSASVLFDSWKAGRFELVSSSEQLDEFRRVTRYPKLKPFIQPALAGTMINEIRSLALMTDPLPRVDRSKDPADNFILAMAQQGKADYLVTGDKGGLLALKRHGNTMIVPVSKMKQILSK